MIGKHPIVFLIGRFLGATERFFQKSYHTFTRRRRIAFRCRWLNRPVIYQRGQTLELSFFRLTTPDECENPARGLIVRQVGDFPVSVAEGVESEDVVGLLEAVGKDGRRLIAVRNSATDFARISARFSGVPGIAFTRIA